MKSPLLRILTGTLVISTAQASLVTNTIDVFTTGQVIATNNATVTNSAAATSIGANRTLILNTTGGDPLFGPTIFGVDDSAQQLVLAVPSSANASFQVIWGGVGGTNGLGGVAFGGGQPLDLFTSVLSFALNEADQPSNFTWTFTDTSSNSASYTGSFPFNSPSSPAVPFNISLASFANANAIDWNSIDFISLSGGNVSGLDMAMDAPIQLVASTVPEPGTWALLATGMAAITIALRRKTHRSR